MSRSIRFALAAIAALLVLPALLIAANKLSPDAPPEGLGPNDQYLLPSETLPFIFLATPLILLIVGLWGVCVFGIAKACSQVSTVFIVTVSLVASLVVATLRFLLVMPSSEWRPLGLYAAAAFMSVVPSMTFCLVAGLPWWAQRAADSDGSSADPI